MSQAPLQLNDRTAKKICSIQVARLTAQTVQALLSKREEVVCQMFPL